MEQRLLDWCRDDNNKPEDTMIYKKSMWNQVLFIRDIFAPMMIYDKCYESNYERVNNNTLVVSTHRSKSIDLPVYKIIAFDGALEMIIRDNFYDFKLSVSSKIPLNCDFLCDIGDKDIPNYYCEGFDVSWVYPHYTEGCKQFTCEIDNQYELYTVGKIIKNFILKNL